MDGYKVYTGKIGDAYSKLKNAIKNENIAQKNVDDIIALIDLIRGIDTNEVKNKATEAKQKAANVYNALKEALEAQTPGSYKYEQLVNLVDDIKETLDTITSGTHADDSNVTVSEQLDSTAQNFDSLKAELLDDASQLKVIKDGELEVASKAREDAQTEFNNLLPINTDSTDSTENTENNG